MVKYVVGDATKPVVSDGIRIIAHVNNNKGGWGAGFVLAVSKRWPEAEAAYRRWYSDVQSKGSNSIPLGQVQMVPVKDEHGRLYVANMVAQDKYVSEDNPIAIRYGALVQCLHDLNKWIAAMHVVRSRMPGEYNFKSSIHMPRIGCGLAGGDWNVIGDILIRSLNYDLYIYDLPEATK